MQLIVERIKSFVLLRGIELLLDSGYLPSEQWSLVGDILCDRHGLRREFSSSLDLCGQSSCILLVFGVNALSDFA